MSQSRPFTFDRVIRILIGLAFVTGVYWLVNRLSNVLLPFFLACLISYILEPLVEFNLKKLHLHWRIAAIFFTLTEVTLVIGGLIYFFLPSVLKEIHDMAAIIRDYSAHNRSLPFIPKE
ncbi:AI-2E family transporter, partial [Duncaniella muris]